MNPRLAILSDIHGNLPALEAVLKDAQAFAPLDAILVAGDTTTPLFRGKALPMLRNLKALLIQGNTEQGLLAMADGRAPAYYWTARQFALSRWSFANTPSEDLDFIRTFTQQRVFHLPGTDPIRIVHGSPRKINESIFPAEHPEQLADVLSLVDEPVVIFGHTHQPWQIQMGCRLALNPGAVCGPLNGKVGAQYAILEWEGGAWQAGLRCISYDLGDVIQEFRDCGLLETGYVAWAFLESILTGRNIGKEFLDHAFQLSRQAGYRDLPYIPDEILEQAGATFPWNSALAWS